VQDIVDKVVKNVIAVQIVNVNYVNRARNLINGLFL
jgi:hypothetical protein